MADIFEKKVMAKGERIKSFIEEACAEDGIELDEIIVSCLLFKTGTIEVYLEDENPHFLGRLWAMVKHQFPEIEDDDIDTDYRLYIEFKFEI